MTSYKEIVYLGWIRFNLSLNRKTKIHSSHCFMFWFCVFRKDVNNVCTYVTRNTKQNNLIKFNNILLFFILSNIIIWAFYHTALNIRAPFYTDLHLCTKYYLRHSTSTSVEDNIIYQKVKLYKAQCLSLWRKLAWICKCGYKESFFGYSRILFDFCNPFLESQKQNDYITITHHSTILRNIYFCIISFIFSSLCYLITEVKGLNFKL